MALPPVLGAVVAIPLLSAAGAAGAEPGMLRDLYEMVVGAAGRVAGSGPVDGDQLNGLRHPSGSFANITNDTMNGTNMSDGANGTLGFGQTEKGD